MQAQDQDFSQAKGALYPFIKRLLGYCMHHKKDFFWFMASTFLIGVIDGIWPWIWMSFLDQGVQPELIKLQEATQNGMAYVADTTLVWKYGSLFIIFGVLASIMVYAFVLLSSRIQEKVLYELRQEMFEKLQHLSFSYYDKTQTGWLLSRLTSDADKVCVLISWGLLDFVYGVTVITACLISMFYFNWKLALIVGMAIPLLFLISIKLRLLVLKYGRKVRKINSELIGSFTEHINGVEVNKITVQENRAGQDFAELTDRMRKMSFRSGYYTAMYMPIVIFVGSMAAVSVIYAGGNMVIATVGGITIGTFAAFFKYSLRIFEPIIEITHFYAFAQNCLSAGERVFGLIDEKTNINDYLANGDFNSIKGDISFENIELSYVDGKPVLADFNLKIEAGTSVALVGPSGEGKSTIVNLLSRFYEPQKGEVKIDGIDYRQRTLKSYRSQLGIVHQHPHLFDGTVRKNVAYGNPTASEEQIVEALKMVAADKLIARLDEEVGEGGDNLSMGERQLVSFARAVLTNPAIFIMDEATSSIDTISEAQIQRGIGRILEGRTAFIIAHRLSTIKNCDRILVIGQGKIVEDGNHQSLIEQKGKYYDLYTRQLRTEKTLESTV